jgi:hypothetical protein
MKVARDRLITAVAAGALLLLGFLPLGNWLSGGVPVPWYGAVAAAFANGLAIALGVGLILAIGSRRFRLLWTPGTLDHLRDALGRHGATAGAVIAGLATLIYLVVARLVFGGRPLHLDELVQVFQARLYASGHLWLPVPEHPEFFSHLHLVMQDGRLYSQFPAGGPAALSLGTLVGAEWLVGPVLGGVSVLLFGAVARRLDSRPLVALTATLLFALAPFMVFMAGTHMNHVPALAAILLGVVGLSRAADDRGHRFAAGLICGLGFGLAATVRPVDALAFALPAAIWLLLLAVRRRTLSGLAGAGIGVALPLAILFWINRETTGDPFTFGYTVLWGAGHGLGFHETPWGGAHTPARGLSLINVYFLRLQTYLFETVFPALLPATAALALTPRLRPLDRYLLAASALLAGLYFLYWHDGFYPGPRFVFPLLPVLAVWSARLLPAVRERWNDGLVLRTVAFAAVVAVVLGATTYLPERAGQYRSGIRNARWNADSAAGAAGVRRALILVRESWGAELVARLWARELTRPQADRIYRSTDACRLDSALVDLERREVVGDSAAAALISLAGDSTELISAPRLTGDPTLRLSRGATYRAGCAASIRANHEGFTVFAPLMLARRHENIWARDLGARDSLLLAQFPDRPVYLLRPASSDPDAPLRFEPMERDSLLAAWRSGSAAP